MSLPDPAAPGLSQIPIFTTDLNTAVRNNVLHDLRWLTFVCLNFPPAFIHAILSIERDIYGYQRNLASSDPWRQLVDSRPFLNSFVAPQMLTEQ